MDQEAKAFLQEWVPQWEHADRRLNETYWNASTTGEKKHEEALAEALRERMRMMADPERFERLATLRKAEIADPLLRRQLTLLYNEMAMNPSDPRQIEEMARLQTEIEGAFVRFRAEVEGKTVTENEIREILRTEKDPYKRKKAWRASKQIGVVVADSIRRLAELRNELAAERGFRDYYHMSLTLNEIEEEELFTALEAIRSRTDGPYADLKKEMDAALAKQYPNLRPEGLRPWHYTDPFFQEAPPVFDVDLDSHFRDRKLEELAVRTFGGMGLDVEDILSRSDLYERDGKSQHAFCLDMDRRGDVRVLCNLRPNAKWMEILLHELGHAVYDANVDRELPYLLRRYAHIATTEAVAMLMGRLIHDPVWLIEVAGISESWVAEKEASLRKQSALAMLVFIRWCLVMIHFERDLYRNPTGDLDTLWWDYVERFQFVPRPEGRRSPDWAAKIHLGTSPVYYQNYLLGEWMASQFFHALQSIGEASHPLVNNAHAGSFLRERIFRPGARYHWQDLLEQATGERLNVERFLEPFVAKSDEAEGK
jgi:peptidyl-dipeptidase A